MALRGQGVPEDAQEAARWFARAAEQGFAPAQAKLGALHEHGRGVPQDRVAAYAWYSLAAGGGDEQAARQRDALAQELTTAEREDGDARARALAPKPAE
jgi:TPR repeat protein